jgi:hypothetical protein
LAIETRSLPSSLAATHRSFAFCLADSIGSAADYRLNFSRAKRALERGPPRQDGFDVENLMLLLRAESQATNYRNGKVRLSILFS